MNQLPSTKALRCFQAVAQLKGIRHAATELNVTQSAVSHQINQLESTLGIALFQKEGRNLVLTPAGQDYLRHIESILHQLEQASSQLPRYKGKPPLTVSAPPTFISNWLLPNLGRFEANHPDVAIRLLESMTYNRADSSIDVAIEYRFKPNPTSSSTAIVMDELSVLAAPSYVEKHQLYSLESLQNVRLIETERRLSSWVDIFWDEPWIKTHRFLTVPYSYHAFEAARLGYGVAVGNTLNAKQLLDTGELIIPFALPKERWPEVPSYYVTVPQEKMDRDDVLGFRDLVLGH